MGLARHAPKQQVGHKRGHRILHSRKLIHIDPDVMDPWVRWCSSTNGWWFSVVFRVHVSLPECKAPLCSPAVGGIPSESSGAMAKHLPPSEMISGSGRWKEYRFLRRPGTSMFQFCTGHSEVGPLGWQSYSIIGWVMSVNPSYSYPRPKRIICRVSYPNYGLKKLSCAKLNWFKSP